VWRSERAHTWYMEDALSLAVLATIFFGAYFDALFVTCLFVFGEAVFLLAGGLAYTSGSALPVLAAYSGAYLADQTSYGLGHVLKDKTRPLMLATARRRKMTRKAEGLLSRRAIPMIAASRFMGPVAWITPPLAGSLRVPYHLFATGSLIGVLLGVGQFLVLGWFSAYGAKLGGFSPEAFLDQHFWTIFITGQALFLLVLLIWRITALAKLPKA